MRVALLVSTVMCGLVIGCRPSDILDVPPPSGEFTSSAIQGPNAELQAFYGARGQLAVAIGAGSNGSVVYNGGLLTDEFGARDEAGVRTGLSTDGALDARYVSQAEPHGQEQDADNALEYLAGARSGLLLAESGLQQYAATTNPATIGEAYALMGYAELLMAEDYCAGVPLSTALSNGGWSFGQPLSQDALFAVAEAHFDSALAHTAGNDTIQGLASVGLGRTLLDRDSLTAAAAAVSSVPTAFVYNTQLPDNSLNISGGQDNMYDVYAGYGNTRNWSMSDREGGNGLPFVSADDPRLLVDSTITETNDRGSGALDTVLYFPLKFGVPSSGLIPLASGIEARLIQAEADLGAGANWLGDLNALRNTGCRHVEVSDTSCVYGTGQVPSQPYGLQSLTDPGTDSARVSLVLYERAFWLFGTGTRLGDLRRQLRQYAKYWPSSATVYPAGPYGTGVMAGVQSVVANYGKDVAFTLPTATSYYSTTNPNYKGCTTPTTQA